MNEQQAQEVIVVISRAAEPVIERIREACTSIAEFFKDIEEDYTEYLKMSADPPHPATKKRMTCKPLLLSQVSARKPKRITARTTC